MKDYEALDLQASCMRMVEGTELKWWECLKGTADQICRHPSHAHLWFKDIQSVRVALAIVEGKPVFVGDELYSKSGLTKCTVSHVDFIGGDKRFVSQEENQCVMVGSSTWQPPRPKTVMVELLVEDAELVSGWYSNFLYKRLADACLKALEAIK